MRFLPLLSSTQHPEPWISCSAVELTWDSELHPGWLRSSIAIHALHLPSQPWSEGLVITAIEALRPRLNVDFLVIPAEAPRDRTATFQFLGALEPLLEALAGRGVKIALRPSAGSAAALVKVLKEVRCDAVGYCWDQSVVGDLDAISDRLFCAVGSPDADYAALQRLGYRWNVGIPATDPTEASRTIAHLEATHPMIYFPQVTP